MVISEIQFTLDLRYDILDRLIFAYIHISHNELPALLPARQGSNLSWSYAESGESRSPIKVVEENERAPLVVELLKYTFCRSSQIEKFRSDTEAKEEKAPLSFVCR